MPKKKTNSKKKVLSVKNTKTPLINYIYIILVSLIVYNLINSKEEKQAEEIQRQREEKQAEETQSQLEEPKNNKNYLFYIFMIVLLFGILLFISKIFQRKNFQKEIVQAKEDHYFFFFNMELFIEDCTDKSRHGTMQHKIRQGLPQLEKILHRIAFKLKQNSRTERKIFLHVYKINWKYEKLRLILDKDEIEKCINEYHEKLSQPIRSRLYSYPNMKNIEICIHHELPNRSIFPTSILSLPVLERSFKCNLPPNYSSLKKYYNKNSDNSVSLSEISLIPNIHFKQKFLDFDRNFLKKMKIRLDNNNIVKIFPVQNILIYPGIIINIDEKIVEEAQFIARIISEIISEIVTKFPNIPDYNRNENKFLNLYLETKEQLRSFNQIIFDNRVRVRVNPILEQIKEQLRSFNQKIFNNVNNTRDINININIHYKLANDYYANDYYQYYSLDQNTEECDPPRYVGEIGDRVPYRYYNYPRKGNLKIEFKTNDEYKDNIEVRLK